MRAIGPLLLEDWRTNQASIVSPTMIVEAYFYPYTPGMPATSDLANRIYSLDGKNMQNLIPALEHLDDCGIDITPNNRNKNSEVRKVYEKVIAAIESDEMEVISDCSDETDDFEQTMEEEEEEEDEDDDGEDDD